MNTIIDFTQYKKKELLPCVDTVDGWPCTYVRDKTRYASDLLFYYMKDKQDDVSKKLEAELKSMARQGENLQYIIVISCIGLVILSTVSIIPIFHWVIKQKSGVLGIFADIEESEARYVIEECQCLDIKNLKYKRKWIGLSEGNQNRLWNKIIAEQQNGFGGKKIMELPGKAVDKANSNNAMKNGADECAKKAVGKSHQDKAAEVEGKDANEINVESVLQVVNPEEIKRKQQKRKELLSEIEYQYFVLGQKINFPPQK